MRLRGRLTLCACALLAVAAWRWALVPDAPAVAALPPVSAPPPSATAPRVAPRSLLQRLPPGARGASVGAFVEEGGAVLADGAAHGGVLFTDSAGLLEEAALEVGYGEGGVLLGDAEHSLDGPGEVDGGGA